MNHEQLLEIAEKLKEFARILGVDENDPKFLDLMAEYWPPSKEIDFGSLFSVTDINEL